MLHGNAVPLGHHRRGCCSETGEGMNYGLSRRLFLRRNSL